MLARTSAAWPLAFTLSHARSILPSAPIRYEQRTMPLNERPMNFFMRQAPYASIILCSGSLRRGKFSFCFSRKLASAFSLSALAPRIATPRWSNSCFASRNSDASVVQPGVFALGKKKRITRLPLKSFSAISSPLSDRRRKLGAFSPALSINTSMQSVASMIDFKRPETIVAGGPFPRAAAQSSGQQLAKNIVDGLRVGLPPRRFHDLPYEKLENTLVARLELRDVVRIVRNHRARRHFNVRIADPRSQSFRGDNLAGAASGIEHAREYSFAHGRGDLAGFHERNQLGQPRRRDRTGSDFLARVVQTSQQFRLHPVRGAFAGRPGFHHILEIVSQRPRSGQHLGVIGRHSILPRKTRSLGRRQFRQRAPDFFAPRCAHRNRKQIRFGEVAIVVR